MMRADVYWCELSKYDLETAEAMLVAKRYLYVGFMCHQSIENSLKAIFTKQHNQIPPRIHNLARLLILVDLADDIPKDLLDVIHQLNPLNIATRYPGEDLDILSSLSEEDATYLLVNTRRLFEWLLTKM